MANLALDRCCWIRGPEPLRQLTQRATDEIVAKKPGLGLRTARRMMSERMARFGARSRFEVGVLTTKAD